MVRWHKTLGAQLGLRASGVAILSLSWLIGTRLYRQVHSLPAHPGSIAEFGLCLVLVVLLVCGNALLFVGPGLWKQVPVPGRWSAALVGPRQFEVFHHAGRSSSGGFPQSERDKAIKHDRESP